MLLLELHPFTASWSTPSTSKNLFHFIFYMFLHPFTANERMVETIGSLAEKVLKGGKIINGIGNQRVYLWEGTKISCFIPFFSRVNIKQIHDLKNIMN